MMKFFTDINGYEKWGGCLDEFRTSLGYLDQKSRDLANKR